MERRARERARARARERAERSESGAAAPAPKAKKKTKGAKTKRAMAWRLGTPATGVGVLVNFWRKASDRLWAGSVEMMRTEERAAAICTASAEEQVVLPTPPFPPTNIHFSSRCASRLRSVGSGTPPSSAMAAAFAAAGPVGRAALPSPPL